MAQALVCSLCNGGHSTTACSFPQEIGRCIRCQLPIFDQKEHNCDARYAAKSFYTDIIAKETFPLFRFVFGGPIYILDENNIFNQAYDGQLLICGATDGMFTISSCESFTSIDYSGISVKQFSFLLAIVRGNTWQLWLRGVVSKSHGLQLFNLDDHFGPINVRPEFMRNTTAVFGILPDLDTVRIKIGFAVYAKSVSNDYETFDGDGGEVEWPRNLNEVTTYR